jgi:hypothetical protein
MKLVRLDILNKHLLFIQNNYEYRFHIYGLPELVYHITEFPQAYKNSYL